MEKYSMQWDIAKGQYFGAIKFFAPLFDDGVDFDVLERLEKRARTEVNDPFALRCTTDRARRTLQNAAYLRKWHDTFEGVSSC